MPSSVTVAFRMHQVSGYVLYRYTQERELAKLGITSAVQRSVVRMAIHQLLLPVKKKTASSAMF